MMVVVVVYRRSIRSPNPGCIALLCSPAPAPPPSLVPQFTQSRNCTDGETESLGVNDWFKVRKPR